MICPLRDGDPLCSRGRTGVLVRPALETQEEHSRGAGITQRSVVTLIAPADSAKYDVRAGISAEPARPACGLALRSLSIASILLGGRGASPAAVSVVLFPKLHGRTRGNVDPSSSS